jgi:hypothetical protein
MTLNEAVISLFWTAGLLAVAPRMWSYWRGEEPADLERNWRRIWPYGDAALQGWIRAQTTLFLAAWFVLLAYFSAVLRSPAEPSARPIIGLALPIGIIGLFAMVVLAASIVLFNWPKRLVFPALRHQEGLLTSWWRRRRRPPLA